MPVIIQDINKLLQGYFDKIFVLTVPRFNDRQEKVKQRLAGLDFEFFYGTDKNELTDQMVQQEYVYDKKISLSVRQYFKEMNRGEIACSLSHRSIYQAMIDNNWQRVLILEDDVIPDFDKLFLLFEALQELPTDWELFYLGYLKNEKPTTALQIKTGWYKILRMLGISNLSQQQLGNIAPRPFSKNIMKAGFHDCTHAYAVSLAGAKKLLQLQTPIKYRADNLLSAAILDEKIKAFATRSFLFNQEIFNHQSEQSHIREPQKLSV